MINPKVPVIRNFKMVDKNLNLLIAENELC